MQETFFGMAKGVNLTMGPRTNAEVTDWARRILADHPKAECVYILSLEAVAERASPPIVVTPANQLAAAEDNRGNK